MGKSIQLFIKSYRAHHSKLAQAEYLKLDLIPIFLPPTTSQFSSVETVWALFKQVFSRALCENVLQNMRLNEENHLRPMVTQALEIVKE